MNKDFKLTLPQKWKKLVILGHNNELNEGDLTLDAEIRLRVGYYLFNHFNHEKVQKFVL